MTLKEPLDKIEKDIGLFSIYQTPYGKAENIPYASKTAQQFLAGLGADKIFGSVH